MNRLMIGLANANRKGPAEPSSIARVATMVAVMTAMWAGLQQDVGHPVLFLLVPQAFWFSYIARNRPGFGVKSALAVGMLVASLRFAQQLAAVGSNVGATQPYLAELFMITQVLHSFDVPARRDLRFSLVASFTLLGMSGVLSQTVGFGTLLAVWTVAAATSLVALHSSEISELPRVTGPKSARPVATLMLATATALVGALLVMAAAFLVLPASGTSRALVFPASLPSLQTVSRDGSIQNPNLTSAGDYGGQATTQSASGFLGFSKSLDTSARGRPDNTIVMRVRASETGFWRGQSFDSWDGQKWVSTFEKPKLLQGDGSSIAVPRPADTPQLRVPTKELVQTVYLQQPGPNLIFGASTIQRVYFADRSVFVLPDGTLRSAVGLGKGGVYTVLSERPVVSASHLIAIDDAPSSGLTESDARRYLQLPASLPERVSALASELRRASSYETVKAIEAWLEANTQYLIDIPPLPPGADSVDRFLFEERIGFCEQIASSLVVLLRSNGIPARLVVGYAGGERNPFTGLFEVRASDAHAWTEVWTPGVGWLPFDPTASVPFAAGEENARASEGLGSYLGGRMSTIIRVVVQGGVGLVLIGIIASLIVGIKRAVAVRRRLALRSWSAAWHDRFDDVSPLLGRTRQPGETVTSYISSLGLDNPWHETAAIVEAEAFSANVPDLAGRRRADDLLSSVARRHHRRPVAAGPAGRQGPRRRHTSALDAAPSPRSKR